MSSPGSAEHNCELAVPLAVLPDTHAQMLQTLLNIEQLLMAEYGMQDLDVPTILTAAEITIEKQGRHFVAIFSPVAVSNVVINCYGYLYTFALAAGWTVLNPPDRAILSGAAGTRQPIIIRYSNRYQGSAI